MYDSFYKEIYKNCGTRAVNVLKEHGVTDKDTLVSTLKNTDIESEWWKVGKLTERRLRSFVGIPKHKELGRVSRLITCINNLSLCDRKKVIDGIRLR